MLPYYMATKHTGFDVTTWQPDILGLMLPHGNPHTGFEIILYFIITLWICSTYLACICTRLISVVLFSTLEYFQTFLKNEIGTKASFNV